MTDHLTTNYHAKVTANRERYSRAIAEASVIFHEERREIAAVREQNVRIASVEYDEKMAEALKFYDEKVTAFVGEWQAEDVAASIELEAALEARNRAYLGAAPRTEPEPSDDASRPGPPASRQHPYATAEDAAWAARTLAGAALTGAAPAAVTFDVFGSNAEGYDFRQHSPPMPVGDIGQDGAGD